MHSKSTIPKFLLITGISTILGIVLSATPSLAQTTTNKASIPTTQAFPALEGLDLTPEQLTQLKPIIQDTRSQIKRILTPAQQDQFRVALEQGQGIRSAATTINLSPDQQRQMRQILQSTRPKIEAILTPEQQQQLSQKANLR